MSNTLATPSAAGQPVKPQNLRSTTFLKSEDFAYTVHVHEVQAPAGLVHVRIASQWRGARHPDEEQTVLRLTLQRSELQALIAGLEAAIQA